MVKETKQGDTSFDKMGSDLYPNKNEVAVKGFCKIMEQMAQKTGITCKGK
jgi:hypothetical protein